MFVLFSVFGDPSLIFNPPETKARDYLFIEFHCLLVAQQWGLDDSSQVFIRFAAAELGSFKHCYGPMDKIIRFADFLYLCTILLH